MCDYLVVIDICQSRAGFETANPGGCYLHLSFVNPNNPWFQKIQTLFA